MKRVAAIPLSGLSCFCAAVETAAVDYSAVAEAAVAEMTAAGLSSCFFSAVETSVEAVASASFFYLKGEPLTAPLFSMNS